MAARRLALALAAAAVLVAPVALALAQDGPTELKDRRGDVRGVLDVVRIALKRNADGRVRGEVTMAAEWGAAQLRAAGPGASVCLRLYSRRDPDAEPPDHLVCMTAPKEGDELVGRVLRDRSNGLARTVGSAEVSRPTPRTAYVRFARAAVGNPAVVRFNAEAVSNASGCPKPLGCRDLAPNAPDTGSLRLRTTAARR